ncbi:S-layer homology domain-containing protein [Paenibacillus sp. P26]|nr:S-layer homology domain-containing protein [Paenibacillus sp. P26]UUZ92040.1 S-layer homology domain-containing protein [Paenibacillus sp. P25]
MGKRIHRSIRTALAIIIGCAISGQALAETKGFQDVDTANPYARYILELQTKGVVEGVDGENFNPTVAVTRAEFVKMLVIAFDLPLDTRHFHFFDLDGHWAANYVQTAWIHGVVSDAGDYTFSPDKPLQRQEAAVMVWNLLKFLGATPTEQPLKLPDSVDDGAKEGVTEVLARNLFALPFKEGGFQHDLSREEAAALVESSVELKFDKKPIERPPQYQN